MPLTFDITPEPAGPSEAAEASKGAGPLLCGAQADDYVTRLQSAVRAARLNAFFPPWRALAAHLGFLGPSGSKGLYETLQLSARSGLPSAREVLRVKIDRDLAADFLARTRAGPAPAADSRMARKIGYYEALLAAEVMPSGRLTLALRQHLPEEGLARFRLVLDRFDLADGQFVRYTLLLTQRDPSWRDPRVHQDEDLDAPTEGFRRIVSRLASHDAELALVLLSRYAHLQVEDVRRGRVGPLWLAGTAPHPALIPLLDPARGPCAGGPAPWILCLPEDRAGLEVGPDASLDPFAPLLREAVGAESREVLDARARELGYRVSRSRKFVCPQPLVAPLSALCRELGAPCIVRGV